MERIHSILKQISRKSFFYLALKKRIWCEVNLTYMYSGLMGLKEVLLD